HAGLRRLSERPFARGRVPGGGRRRVDGERPGRADPRGAERLLDLGLERPGREVELLRRELRDLPREDRVAERVEVQTGALPDQDHVVAFPEVRRVAALRVAEPIPRIEVDDATGDIRRELD